MFHLPLFASSPIFPLTSQTPTTLLEHDEHVGPDERSHCDDLRQRVAVSRRQSHLQVKSPNSWRLRSNDSEAISPEDLEPRRIELDSNLGTDPYQIHERPCGEVLLLEIWRKSEKFRAPCVLTCNQHHCICRIEKTMNPLECQPHQGNLLHCYRREEQMQSVLKLS